MSRDPAFGPKTLAHEFRAVADDIVAVWGARFATDTSTGTRSARGFACVPITKRAAAFAAARLHKSLARESDRCSHRARGSSDGTCAVAITVERKRHPTRKPILHLRAIILARNTVTNDLPLRLDLLRHIALGDGLARHFRQHGVDGCPFPDQFKERGIGLPRLAGIDLKMNASRFDGGASRRQGFGHCERRNALYLLGGQGEKPREHGGRSFVLAAAMRELLIVNGQRQKRQYCLALCGKCRLRGALFLS